MQVQQPAALVFARHGDLYVVNHASDNVSRYDQGRQRGCHVEPLPAGS